MPLSIFITIISVICLNLWANDTFEVNKNKSCQELKEIWQKNVSSDIEGSKVFKSVSTHVRGTVILAHGLNLRPSKMGDDKTDGTLAYFFLNQGYHVIRLTLKGHDQRENPAQIRTVLADDWKNEAYLHYCQAMELSQGKTILLVGFSLGALLYEEMLNEKTKTPIFFHKAILFAPAIATKKITHLVKALIWLFPNSMILNSLSEETYRAQKGASLQSYKVLFKIEESLVEQKFKNNNIPTLVMVDPNDELVSISGMIEHINRFSLSKWTLTEVQDGPRKFHHTIIDEHSLGKDEWLRLNALILRSIGQ